MNTSKKQFSHLLSSLGMLGDSDYPIQFILKMTPYFIMAWQFSFQ